MGTTSQFTTTTMQAPLRTCLPVLSATTSQSTCLQLCAHLVQPTAPPQRRRRFSTTAATRISGELMKQIQHYASFPQTGVSLRQMVMFGQNPSQGTLLRASQFLAEELPIRLARRVKELDELPNNLSKMPSVEKVKEWYATSFEELVTFPKPNLPPEIRQALMRASSETHSLPEAMPNPSLPTHMKQSAASKSIHATHRYYADPGDKVDWPPEVHQYNEEFTRLLSNIKRRHDPVVTTIAQGILEYKRANKFKEIDRSIQIFLDRFYMSRIGIRVLIGQHIALNRLEPHPDYVGIICTKTNIHQIATEAIENATFVCEEHYGLFKAPPVQLVCPKHLTFPYIPSHLNHMLFEVLKNSLRATVETHGVAADLDVYVHHRPRRRHRPGLYLERGQPRRTNGWLRLRLAHCALVRTVLWRQPTARLHGRIWHRLVSLPPQALGKERTP